MKSSKPTDWIGAGGGCPRRLCGAQEWRSIRRDWPLSNSPGTDGRMKGKRPSRLGDADGWIRQPRQPQRQQLDSRCCNIPGDGDDDDVAKLRLRGESGKQPRLQRRSLAAVAVVVVVVAVVVAVDCDDLTTIDQRW